MEFLFLPFHLQRHSLTLAFYSLYPFFLCEHTIKHRSCNFKSQFMLDENKINFHIEFRHFFTLLFLIPLIWLVRNFIRGLKSFILSENNGDCFINYVTKFFMFMNQIIYLFDIFVNYLKESVRDEKIDVDLPEVYFNLMISRQAKSSPLRRCDFTSSCFLLKLDSTLFINLNK